MILQELEISKLIKRYRDPGLVLTAAGWNVLGQGVDGAVAEHPLRDEVIKLFDSRSAYTSFVEYAAQHQSNPHLPHFIRYVKKVPDSHLSYVRMETLSSTSYYDVVTRYPAYVLSAYSIALSYKVKIDLGKVEDIKSDLKIQDIPQPSQLAAVYQSKGLQPPSSQWTQSIHDLASIAKARHHEWDLHPHNLMKRDDGTLVITDPFWNDLEIYEG